MDVFHYIQHFLDEPRIDHFVKSMIYIVGKLYKNMSYTCKAYGTSI